MVGHKTPSLLVSSAMPVPKTCNETLKETNKMETVSSSVTGHIQGLPSLGDKYHVEQKLENIRDNTPIPCKKYQGNSL